MGSFSATVAVTAAPVTAVCLYSTKAGAKKSSRSPLLFPASSPAGDSQSCVCCLRLWPSGLGLLSWVMGNSWLSASLFHLLRSMSPHGAIFPSCIHTGVLCPAPKSVCLPSSLIIIKAGRQWPCANLPRQAPSFPGLCLLFQQLLLPQMLGPSCHFQPAWSRKFAMLSKQCAKGSYSTECPCHWSSLGILLMKVGCLTLYFGAGTFRSLYYLWGPLELLFNLQHVLFKFHMSIP